MVPVAVSSTRMPNAATSPIPAGTTMAIRPHHCGVRESQKSRKPAASSTTAPKCRPCWAATCGSPPLVSNGEASGASWVSHQIRAGKSMVSGSQ